MRTGPPSGSAPGCALHVALTCCDMVWMMDRSDPSEPFSGASAAHNAYRNRVSFVVSTAFVMAFFQLGPFSGVYQQSLLVPVSAAFDGFYRHPELITVQSQSFLAGGFYAVQPGLGFSHIESAFLVGLHQRHVRRGHGRAGFVVHCDGQLVPHDATIEVDGGG